MGTSPKASPESGNGELRRHADAVHSGTTPAYFDDPKRQRGELPPSAVTTDIRDVVRQVAGAPISRRERVAARFIDRLSVPLTEFDDVTDPFETWAQVGDACRKVLGERRSRDLAAELGYAATGVLAVAHALGYEPSDDE